MSFIVAAAQYPISVLPDWESYAAKITGWLEEAARVGAKLAVFPEYGAMELGSLHPASMGDLAGSLARVSDLLPRVDALHVELATRLGLHILAASAPCRKADGRFVNRARLFAPSGAMGWQDKLVMTRFEREQWGVSAGTTLRLFDTVLGRIGVAICYDSEFPLIARALVEAGAELLLVPSCTDSEHGYWRVRLGAQARALEGQCYVVQSPTVGDAAWSPAVDVNHGAAGIYAPPDGKFPADGVISSGALDVPQWVVGTVDFAKTARLRVGGAVLNHRDWGEQPGVGPTVPVELIDLR
jgi:predicted amidohydrolase